MNGLALFKASALVKRTASRPKHALEHSKIASAPRDRARQMTEVQVDRSREGDSWPYACGLGRLKTEEVWNESYTWMDRCRREDEKGKVGVEVGV